MDSSGASAVRHGGRGRRVVSATMEGDAGAARSMESTVCAPAWTRVVVRDRHRDRLRVIDADIRRAEEEGFAADAKVVSAREDLRRLERARDDARRRYAVLIARRKMANVTTRALAERDAALRRPHGGARTFPIPDVRGGVSPTSFTSSRRRAGCETPAWNLRRVRASADATRLEGASCRVTSADDPNPGVPKVPNTHHAAPRPPGAYSVWRGSISSTLRRRRRRPAASRRRSTPEPSPRATRAMVPRRATRLDRLVKETWRTPTGGVCSTWHFQRRARNCHRRQFYLRGCPYQ